jgi:hypothetical protein
VVEAERGGQTKKHVKGEDEDEVADEHARQFRLLRNGRQKRRKRVLAHERVNSDAEEIRNGGDIGDDGRHRVTFCDSHYR